MTQSTLTVGTASSKLSSYLALPRHVLSPLLDVAFS
jgi:hypothetical protein